MDHVTPPNFSMPPGEFLSPNLDGMKSKEEPSAVSEAQLQSLRNSILPIEKSIHGDIGIPVTAKEDAPEPQYSSQKPAEGTDVPADPLVMMKMLSVLNRKRIPYCMVYITMNKEGVPITNFVTTMGGGAQAVELVKHVVDENATKFGE
jgi:hypothetical protein